MTLLTPVRPLTLTEANAHVADGAAFVDLRDVDDYLDVHIAGSFGLEYERGPGLAGRARDILPPAIPLVLLDEGDTDVPAAAAALRGKGFTVIGALPGGVSTWADSLGTPASTERSDDRVPPAGRLLDVGEAGAPQTEDDLRIPIEELAARTAEVPAQERIVICAGRGLRAALAVGILERAGIGDLVFWSPAVRRKRFGKAGVVTRSP